MSEEQYRKPEEIYITAKLTLKDYYDIRDLRLLLWSLKSELCEKYGVSKACDLADKLKPTIEAKLKEIEGKL
jgi:hypothetical protein